MNETLEIHWDIGTAYDFYISLIVLHDPSSFGLRAAWAAGMRSRLPNADRDALEAIKPVAVEYPPFHWLYSLPDPKNGETLLASLEALPAAERLPTVVLYDKEDKQEHNDLIYSIIERGAFDDEDVDRYREITADWGKKRPSRKDAAAILDVWADNEANGERMLSAFRSYYEVFFAEEERRIQPALQTALEHAQELAERLSITKLIEELSQGVSFEYNLQRERLVLTPSFWATPFIWFGAIDADTEMVAFGGRPATASLVPGEVVPDALVRALKAISDPTRLRILHYLAGELLTPTQLANRLRLRPPTVVHHLRVLRMAGLVRVRISEGKEKSYAARIETVETTFEMLRDFIAYGGSELVGMEEAFAEEA